MTEREALKLALEALEDMHIVDFPLEDLCNWNKAITAIKEALAQPEQEPVVWMYQDKSTHEVRFQKHMRDFVDHGATYETPLYTTPPQLEREPVAWMRDDEMKAMVSDEKRAWILCGRSELIEEYNKPLYTTPPQRKPLTDKQIRKLWAQHAAKQNGWPNDATPPMIDIGNGPRFQAHWHESEYQIFRDGFKAAHGIKE